MSEMVERVAKALWGDRHPDIPWNDFDKLNYMGHARAAIAAMREPTEAMKNCSDEVHWGYSCNTCGGLTDGWHKMMDEALR